VVFGQIVSTYQWLDGPETATPTPTQPFGVLQFAKSANPQTYSAVGQTITYSFQITNTGTTPLGPAQFTINDSKLGAPFNCGPADAVLQPGQSLTCSMNYTTTVQDMALANITNSATASGAGLTSAPASVTVTNLAAPASPTPTATPTGLADGTVTGQVIANKPVTVSLYNGDTLVTSAAASSDGTFSLTAPAGTYTIAATASGYLKAEGSATISAGGTSTKPTISLMAGDLDGNDMIDQFDALTIGMNYNASAPPEADLNNDGVINVLDLELLANNYRQLTPQEWN
jgi:uncharacterized repeat protein (TIGR01451 family)